MNAQDIINKSGIFDTSFYFEKNSDVKESGMDPIEHYCLFGHKEGRDPNHLFCTRWYRMHYNVNENSNPLLDYLKSGWKQKRNPHYKFDIEKFNENNQSLILKNEEPLKQYLSDKNRYKPIENYRMDYGNGDVKTILKSGLFSETWYLKKNLDLSFYDPILHYVAFGHKEYARKPNPFFDALWYKNTYSIDESDNALVHYINIGSKLGYSPSPNFSSEKYLEEYTEVKEAGLEPLVHFLSVGRQKGYKTFKLDHQTSVRINKEVSIASQIFPDLDFVNDYEWKETHAKDFEFNQKELNIHFVIPDFAAGGGGHMNIFRMLWHLEKFGHKITIWIFRPSLHNSAEEAYDDIIRHYNTLRAEVKFVDENFKNATGDVIFASSWDTVWPVGSTTNFKRRFYFIQDYETSFYSKGARSQLAELTYRKELDCICASTWLESLMKKKYKKWAKSFNLTADTNLFYPRNRPKNKRLKIVFYARMHTSRRAVELGFLALEALAKEGLDFHVDCYGADYQLSSAPFSCTVYKTRTPEQLSEMYASSDIGLVFSLTNYSLVPQEMMACGLPVVEYEGESTRAIYPEGVVTFSGPTPIEISQSILNLAHNEKLRENQSKLALDWVRKSSWEDEARKVESSIIERLLECNFKHKTTKLCPKTIKASVIILTCNPGAIFEKVFLSLLEQITPWDFEIIILDSETNDGSVDFVKGHEKVVFETIKRKDFNHGRTRNHGIDLAKGEFVALLTHDAIPSNNQWLYNIVTTLEHFPEAAGAFGKHVAHDDATFYTKKEMDMHFQSFERFPYALSKKTEIPRDFDIINWKEILRFYSDNNSCLRKSVWEKIPYREVQYGEDQLWGLDVIAAGYQKVYASTAIVKHSHDYEPDDLYERSKIDGDYFKFFFDQILIKQQDKSKIISEINSMDELIGYENGLSDAEIEYRLKCNEAKINGYADGAVKEKSMFEINSSEKSKF
ncbi:glycosyltransferase [Alteromonas sp. 1_MG-2023]|uniref:rhamnosyltransferase WsaF family glycosyltransferase n=1 Tax=Alteromonas sp. 1_MG-2023 TaxID=3062669 RepID=UPI0026E36D2E|nr:glycosyltransferase [Alteromonas sp. 1_MG-2023]MDO6477529.1 glycosyltransferase [Alteromonas sp. 1_MG-2023]